MKKILLICVMVAVFSSCSHDLSGQLVKDVKGNVYLVRKNGFKSYKLDKIDSNEYKKLN